MPIPSKTITAMRSPFGVDVSDITGKEAGELIGVGIGEFVGITVFVETAVTVSVIGIAVAVSLAGGVISRSGIGLFMKYTKS